MTLKIKEYYDKSRKYVHYEQEQKKINIYLEKIEDFAKIKRCPLKNILRSSISSEYIEKGRIYQGSLSKEKYYNKEYLESVIKSPSNYKL